MTQGKLKVNVEIADLANRPSKAPSENIVETRDNRRIVALEQT